MDATEEAFFVCVENGNQRNFGKIEAFAEEIDANQNIINAHAEIAENVGAFHGVDVAVDVGSFDATIGKKFREVLGHFLGEGGGENSLALGNALVDFFDEVVDLVFAGTDFDFGIEQACRTDDLLGDVLAASFEFILVWGG